MVGTSNWDKCTPFKGCGLGGKGVGIGDPHQRGIGNACANGSRKVSDHHCWGDSRLESFDGMEDH